MIRKTLAALLILSWIILSSADILEDLSFESDVTFYSSPTPRSSHSKKPVRLVNDSVELAYPALSFGRAPQNADPECIAYQTFLNACLDSRAFRNHKDRRVRLI